VSEVARVSLPLPCPRAGAEDDGCQLGADRGCGTADAKGVDDPPRRQTKVGAGEPIRSAYGVTVGGQKLVVALSQSHEHTGQRARHRLRGQTSTLVSPTQLVSLKAR
jgi:hypothetical protein